MKFIKHHTNARNNIKLQRLRAAEGQKGYGQYWSLLEALGEKFNGEETLIPIHLNEIASAVDLKFTKSVMTFIQKLTDFELIEFKAEGEVFRIKADILLELQDKDSRYNRKRIVKRSQRTTLEVEVDKEVEVDIDINNNTSREFPGPKKILSSVTPQENLKVVSLEKFTPDHFQDLWNTCFGKKLSYCHGLGGGVHRDNFLASLEFLPTEKSWRDLFQICTSTPYLMGQNNIGWTISPTWIVNYDNALKVLNGDYDGDKAVKAIFASMNPEETA